MYGGYRTNVSTNIFLHLISDFMENYCGRMIEMEYRGIYEGILSFRLDDVGKDFNNCTVSINPVYFMQQLSFYFIGW